jgi:hypothetical protein
MKNIVFLFLISLICISCQKEVKPINIKNALINCREEKGESYGVMLFGDSMLNFPTSHIMSYISNITNTYHGLGNCYYPAQTNLVNNKGGFLNPESGAVLYDVNAQNTNLGQPEWAGRLGVMQGSGQSVRFVTSGVYPKGVTTKLFILTDTYNTGTYDIERTTDNGKTWSIVVYNDTTLDIVKGMKVHLFDDTSETIRVGYRIVLKTGRVMCLDPLFLKAGGNNIYHITVGSGGADFKLQTSIPKERVRFLIDECNIKMITSSHRYEVEDVNEFNTYQNLMDEWWDGKDIDVLYFGQPPQTNDNADANQLKQNINKAMFTKALEKEYLYYDMYIGMGGFQRVVDAGWGDSDPVHLSHKAYEAIAPKLFSYLEFNNEKIRNKNVWSYPK